MAGQSRAPSAPASLRAPGKALWKSVNAAYELDSALREVLRNACGTLDLIEQLDTTIADEGTMSIGSTGQRVVHPAVLEIRQQRALLRQLIAALNLPEDEDEDEVAERERKQSHQRHQKAKDAAAARWAGGSHGR